MASAFGDQSYSKLPPIRKGSLKDSQDQHEEEKDSSQVIDFNREGHGLVRLPPIIRIDSSEAARERELHDESKANHSGISNSENNDSFFASQRQLSSDLSFKQKPNSSQSDINLTESMRAENTTRDSYENTRDSHLIKSDTHCRIVSGFEIDTSGEHNLDNSKVQSQLLNTRQVDRSTRRSSLITAEPQKLHRGRRLAKSSPDLSSTRKIYKSPIREPKGSSKGRAEIDSIAASYESDSKNEQFDISFNIPSKGDQKSPRSPRNGKGRGIAKKVELKHKVDTKGDFLPHSSPCTPVVQLMSDEHDNISPREGRQSLGDINSIIAPQRGRKPSIVSTKRKLSVRDEIQKESLRVDGKMCYKNERLTARAATGFRPAQHPSRDGFLRAPDYKAKRDSIYDLQQILAMLNKEESTTNPDSSKRDNRSSSVYDLKGFLQMSTFPEAMEPGTNHGKQSNNLNLQKSENIDSLTVPLVVEPGNRRGSTYDLLEFLGLNFAATKSKDNVQGGDTTKGVRSSPPANSPFLSPGDSENSPSIRRSSAYDLMEFLSLSRRAQSEEATKTDDNSPSQPSLTVATHVSEQGEPRKNSIYNLEEFLGLSKSLPAAAAIVPESEAPGSNQPPTNSLLSPKLPSNFKFKRESIYDLQEFLGILQKETDSKRTVNPPEDTSKPSSLPRVGLDEPVKDQETSGQTNTQSNESHRNRSLSIYDLREFLTIYANQSSQPNPTSQNRVRKTSSISQSSIMINVSEDEFGNESVGDVFLAVPVEGALGRKQSSVSELSELLNTLGEHSSVVSPSPVSRHDSGGGKSLYDLGEFLSMLNTDDSPLRRRLSSVSDRGNSTPSGLSRNDSSGGSSLYDLEEFLTILNDNGKEEDKSRENKEENVEQEISISVPQLPSRGERNGNERMNLMKRRSFTAQRSGFNSVPESADIAGKPTEERRASLGHCL